MSFNQFKTIQVSFWVFINSLYYKELDVKRSACDSRLIAKGQNMRMYEPYTIFPRTLKSGKVVYYYQFRTDSGARKGMRSTGCTTLTAARRYVNQLYNAGLIVQSERISFYNYSKDFFSETQRFYKWKIANKEHISKETLLAYDKFLRNQLMPYFKDFPIDKIKRSDIKDWVIYANEKWSPKTVNSAQSVLNILLKSAVEEEIIDFNPCANLSFRTIEKKTRNLLTLEEVKAMYHQSKWWYDNQLVFLLDIITGLRISELVALTADDVKKNYIDVNKSYSRTFGMGNVKTYENRFVPIPEELALSLKLRNGFLFQNHEGRNRGKPLNINSFYTNLMDIYKAFGIDPKERGLAVHTCRNFYNTYLISENVPEPKIRAVMGHKDNTMTNLYTYWKPEMFPEVYKAQEKLYKEILCQK